MPETINNEKYATNPDYILREIVGEYMLIPTGQLSMTSSGVITISESAAYLWRNMKEGKTIPQLCELLLNEYEVDEETAQRDISEMIDSMTELNIIKKLP